MATGNRLVGARGFEPPTPCAQGRCATRLRYAPTLSIITMILAAAPLRHPHRERVFSNRRMSLKEAGEVWLRKAPFRVWILEESSSRRGGGDVGIAQGFPNL